MPELPEVTVIVNSLNKKITGLILEAIEYDWPKKFFWNHFSIKDLKGKKVVEVRRLGKIVVIDLERDMNAVRTHSRSVVQSTARSHSGSEVKETGISILIHLKLTGQLIYEDSKTRVAGGHPIPPLNLPVPNKTTRVTFTFTNQGRLFFNDMRKFGWVKIVTGDKEQVTKAVGELGPDPLVMSYGEFCDRLVRRGQSRIKKLLMDQSFIAGVGNIYSDEALWRAKIHPKRSAISLSPSEIRNLYEGIKDSLKLAIEKGGSSASAFVDSGGERGLYLSFANAYHMTGRPCARCKTPIVRQKMDGRSAHFCPNCQKFTK